MNANIPLPSISFPYYSWHTSDDLMDVSLSVISYHLLSATLPVQVQHSQPVCLYVIMCSLFLYLCLFSLCFADKVKPPKSEKDDVEVFQKIVLPPLLTPKDSAPPEKLGKLTWGNKWNSRVVRPFGRDQVGVGTGGWYDRSNPGNEVPTWGKFSKMYLRKQLLVRRSWDFVFLVLFFYTFVGQIMKLTQLSLSKKYIAVYSYS